MKGAREWTIYDGCTAQPRVVGPDIAYAENVKVIEFSAFAKADEKLRRMDERYNGLRETLLYFQEHGYDPAMAREALKKN